jgi:hypothetical protein
MKIVGCASIFSWKYEQYFECIQTKEASFSS